MRYSTVLFDADGTLLDFLLGEKEVSYYDKVLDNWYKNGGTEYVEEMNEYITNIEKASK